MIRDVENFVWISKLSDPPSLEAPKFRNMVQVWVCTSILVEVILVVEVILMVVGMRNLVNLQNKPLMLSPSLLAVCLFHLPLGPKSFCDIAAKFH